jgi:RNA polymerase sigma factor (sigma-70 family)
VRSARDDRDDQEQLVNPSPENPPTNPTIFLRLNQADPVPREMAWEEFRARYAPVIAGFARRLGARPQDVDDVIQDVMLGFYAKSPTFVYDPGKGRFRGYLKVCTFRALRRRIGNEARLQGKPLDEVDPEAVAVEQVWSDVWEHEQLRRLLEEVRQTMGHTKTFRAFELFVVFDQPAQAVAEKLGMHINSVYRAKEQVTRLLQEKAAALREME